VFRITKFSVYDRQRVSHLMMPQISISAAIVSTVVFLTATFGPHDAARRPAGAESPRHALTVQDSALFTEEQATAGAATFGKICAECHEKADITKPDFRSKWNGRTLFELFELVRTTMPDSNPGGLTREEYAGALAYILKVNGLPAGTTAVMPDSAAMSNVKLSLPPQSN
jgi:cytochrome c5